MPSWGIHEIIACCDTFRHLEVLSEKCERIETFQASTLCTGEWLVHASPQSGCRGIINYPCIQLVFSLHHVVARCHIRPEVKREASASGIDPRSLLSLNSSAYLNNLLAETVIDNGQVKYSSRTLTCKPFSAVTFFFVMFFSCFGFN